MDNRENGNLSLSERVRSLRLPDKANDPRPFAIVPWALVFLFALTTTGFGYMALQPRPVAGPPVMVAQASDDKKGGAVVAPPAASPVIAPGGVMLESKGYIVPVHQIQVSPKVGGTVMEMYFEEGKQVKAGDVLALLETTEYQHDFDRLDAMARAAKHRFEELTKYRDLEIRQAKADLNDALAQRDAALKDYRRNVDLEATRAVSPREIEQAESAYKSAQARVERLTIGLEMWIKGPRDEKIAAAKAELEQVVAEREKAKWKLDNTTVRAPVSGTILTKKAEKGNQVNPAAFSSGLSASLCDMADLSDLEVDLAIAERDIGRVFKGQMCKVVSEAFTDRPYEGIVSRLMPQADRAKGAVPVRVKIAIPRDEEGRYLRPDMGAIVTFYNKSDDPPSSK